MADSERCSSDSAALRRTVVEQTRSMRREPEKVWERERVYTIRSSFFSYSVFFNNNSSLVTVRLIEANLAVFSRGRFSSWLLRSFLLFLVASFAYVVQLWYVVYSLRPSICSAVVNYFVKDSRLVEIVTPCERERQISLVVLVSSSWLLGGRHCRSETWKTHSDDTIAKNRGLS